MKDQIRQLVCQVQSYPRDTQERQQALGTLVKQILRSRKICPPIQRSTSIWYLSRYFGGSAETANPGSRADY
ncbi:hypothetical protein [Moorena producens]|uniref:hypothetical protein n=1 Tax=Moorena producens TaxID=1155739 RepID=UPI003C70CD86